MRSRCCNSGPGAVYSGARVGDEVVQMYIHHVVSSVVQPLIALRGFKVVRLEPGASTMVSFDVDPDRLSILDARMQKTVEPGPVEVRLGANSAETSPVQWTIE